MYWNMRLVELIGIDKQFMEISEVGFQRDCAGGCIVLEVHVRLKGACELKGCKLNTSYAVPKTRPDIFSLILDII